MIKFFAELKRRHIYRVAAAYAVVAWVLIQLVSNVSPMLRLPDWAGTFVLVLLFVGFPVALLFAWIHQLAPESGALTHVTTGKSDWFLAGALVVVIALVSYQQFGPVSGVRTAAPQQAGVAAAQNASLSPAGAISIAVLPFENLSGDATQEFFSNGMTEEITAALVKVSGLNVVARTSAFQFKAQNRDIQSIGQQLHASHFIEGSVRKAGNRVRITAQLIAADSGVHLWAENYDRELTDVFAIQEEIATAIAGALRVPLGLKAGQNLVSNRTTDTDSYQDYLRARVLVQERGGTGGRTEAVKLLEQVVARDPKYAPAWGMLGQAYGGMAVIAAAFSNGSTDELRRIRAEWMQKAEAAAQQAIRLDPNHIDGYTALALARNYRGQFVQAEDLYKQALSLDSGNPEALQDYSQLLADTGRLKDSLAMKLRLQALEPFVPAFNAAIANALWVNGRNEEAIAIFKASPRRAFYNVRLAETYASMGRYSDAADELQEILTVPARPGPGGFPPRAVEEAIRLLRKAPAQTASPQTILSGTGLEWVYLYVGAPNRALERFENAAEAGAVGGGGQFWAPTYAPLRKTERFKAYVRKIGLVDYWKARGWPEFCHPTTGDDFVCV